MKNTNKIIAIFVAFFLIGGCADLEENPQGLLAPEGFFKSPKDVEAAIYGAYGRMASDAAWGGEMQQGIMLLGDMVDVGQDGAAIQNFEINNFTASSTHYYSRVIWRRAYDIIGSANTAIAGAKTINANEEVKLSLEAEARVIRANMYYVLIRLFGDIPYLDEPVSKPDVISTVSKTQVSDVYKSIIEDLEFGIEYLPSRYSNNVRTRATSGTAATILASVHLTLENWEQAYNNAKWVIDRSEEFDYKLVPDYQTLFDATKQDGISEHIFAVDFLGGLRHSDNDDVIPPLTGNQFTGGWSIIIPSMAVYTTWDQEDYRRKVSMADTIVYKGVPRPYTDFKVPRPHIAKYFRFPGNALGGSRRSDHNYVLYRYAEVLLIAAEALNEIKGPTSEAVGYVNQVRKRARHWPEKVSEFPSDISTDMSKEVFRKLILDDRRLEFAFEYKRWFDIKRRKLGDEVFKGPMSLEPHPDFDGNKHYLLPIPQTELDINPNLKPQNPGY